MRALVLSRHVESADSRRRDGVQRPRWRGLGVFVFLGFLAKRLKRATELSEASNVKSAVYFLNFLYQ